MIAPAPTAADVVHATNLSSRPIVRVPGATAHRATALFGIAYLVSSLVCAVWYLDVLKPSLANDLFWPRWNNTGVKSLLVDVVNAQLNVVRPAFAKSTTDVSLLISAKSYGSRVVRAQYQATAARHLLHTGMNSLGRAIQDIRKASPAEILNVVAQYCWVDLDRRWDIAHTAQRSKRCSQRYRSNAAVYLDTMLRNTNWTAFIDFAGNPWPIAIGRAVQASPEGRVWIDAHARRVLLDVDDEVALLSSRYNISRFDLPWHNQHAIGVGESVLLENALGWRQRLALKATPAHNLPWTSMTLFTNFFNDLLFMELLNMSLVRTAPDHFEHAISYTYFYGLEGDDKRYHESLGAFVARVGVFGSVDLAYEPVPSALWRSHSKVIGLSFGDCDAATRDPLRLAPLPPAFSAMNHTSRLFLGGNLLCMTTNAPGTTFPQAQLHLEDSCGSSRPFEMTLTPPAARFALLSGKLRPANFSTLCHNNNTNGDAALDCLDVLHRAWAHILPWTSTSLVNSSEWGLDPPASFVQYVVDDGQIWRLLEQPLLVHTDPLWSFYGLVAIYDWIGGRREVVRFEGDSGSLLVMSELYEPRYLLGSEDSLESDTQLLQYLVAYTTMVMVVVGAVVVVAAGGQRCCVRGVNLFRFHRVAGFVWIGRPLLLLRGCTAIIVLSTTRPALTTDSFGRSRFHNHRRPLVDSMLVAGEATWMSYVLQDILLLVHRRHYTMDVAVASLALAWTVTLCIEVQQPVQLVASLQRRCAVNGIDKFVLCGSGVVKVGDLSRVTVLLLVQLASYLVPWSILYARSHRRRRANASAADASWIMPGSAIGHFVAQRELLQTDGCGGVEGWYWPLDSPTCVMSGLIPLPRLCMTMDRGNQPSHFDIKLWRFARTRRSDTGVAYIPCPAAALPCAPTEAEASPSRMALPPRPWHNQQTLVAGVGLLYIVVTAASSLSYLAVTHITLANDFFWTTFNLTTHHVAIATLMNEHVALGRTAPPFRLDEPRWHVLSDLTAGHQKIPAARWTPPRLHHSLPLTTAIQGLRNTDACALPWVFTPYCWVDFGRTWVVAHSVRRALRCAQHEQPNAAVYLEAVLRNTDWTAWIACWGAAFAVGFGQDLATSKAGQDLLAFIAEGTGLSVDDEATAWAQAGLGHYTLQWQNFKLLGLVNTYAIESAFGVQHTLTLSYSNGTFRLPSQTTHKMYWGLASDLWAITTNTTRVGGLSLIRSSPRYAFANASLVQVMADNGTVTWPLHEAYALVESTVGPFGTIDMHYVDCPDSVKQVVAAGYDILRAAIARNATAAAAYKGLMQGNGGDLMALPSVFLDNIYWKETSGGSILCAEGARGSPLHLSLTEFVGRTTSCEHTFVSSLKPTKDTLIMASLASNLTVASADRVCAHLLNTDDCAPGFAIEYARFVNELISPTQGTAVAAMRAAAATAAETDVWPLQVEMFQYVRNHRPRPSVGGNPPALEMLRAPLLDPDDPTFAFWGWLYVVEWAMGAREVVRFHGDKASITLITEWTAESFQSIMTDELPTAVARYALRGVQYVTGVLIAISVLTLLYIVACGGHIEGRNMLENNRVAGLVWVGRPLLVVRGVTALVMFSTAALEFHPAHHASSHFVSPKLPWIRTALGASEATWLVYVVNDLFTVATTHYTLWYACGSSLLVWLVSALLTVTSPVTHDVTISPQCVVDHMDLQLTCHSGVVRVGHVDRMYVLLGIIAGANVVAFGVTWHCRRSRKLLRRQPATESALVLSAAANYLFDRSQWIHDGVYYLDPASALLNGLVTYAFQGTTYVVDIKLWRVLTVHMDPAVRRCPQLRLAIPVTQPPNTAITPTL